MLVRLDSASGEVPFVSVGRVHEEDLGLGVDEAEGNGWEDEEVGAEFMAERFEIRGDGHGTSED